MKPWHLYWTYNLIPFQPFPFQIISLERSAARDEEEYPVIDLCTDDEDNNDDTIENPEVVLHEAQRVAMLDWETDSDDPSSGEEMEDSSADVEVENSFASEMSSDFGDIFQYEHDLSYDAFQCSTPVSTPILENRRIFGAACNDSICLAKGDKGPNAWAVDSHYSFDSDNGQPYYVEEYFTYPTKKSDSYYYDYSSVFEESGSDAGCKVQFSGLAPRDCGTKSSRGVSCIRIHQPRNILHLELSWMICI